MKKIISGKKFGFYAGEKLRSLTNNQLHNLKQEAAQIACEEMFIIAIQAMKDTFKDAVSNEQIECFLKRLQYLINKVGNHTILLSTLVNVIEAENNIKYDANKKEWYNLDKIDN